MVIVFLLMTLMGFGTVTFLDKTVVLFSLPSADDTSRYFHFIHSLKCVRLINISSTCIFAYPYYLRSIHLLPNYLRLKYHAHHLTRSRSNSVNIIVGILDQEFKYLDFPFSAISAIASIINTAIDMPMSLKSLSDLYAFKILKTKHSPGIFVNILLKLRFFLKKYVLASIVFDVLLKLFRFPLSSYTFYSCLHFSNRIRIGDGAFGCVSAQSGELVFRSTESNYNLWDFPTPPLIGSTKIGLDQLRHGVYIQIKDGFFRKIWCLGLRYRNPFRFFKHSQTIRKIKWHSRFSLFEIIDSSGNQYFSNTLNLAAGAIVNTKLLLGMIQDSERLPLQASLSDHLCTSLGKVTIDDLIRNYILKSH